MVTYVITEQRSFKAATSDPAFLCSGNGFSKTNNHPSPNAFQLLRKTVFQLILSFNVAGQWIKTNGYCSRDDIPHVIDQIGHIKPPTPKTYPRFPVIF